MSSSRGRAPIATASASASGPLTVEAPVVTPTIVLEPAIALELSAPQPVLAVAVDEAESGIVPDAEVATRIEAMAATFIESVVSLDTHDVAYGRRIADINSIGEREIIATSEMSSRLLDRPVRALGSTLDGASPIARNLLELRKTVDDLDPARHDFYRKNAGKLFGVIPVRDGPRSYVDRSAKAQRHIRAIVRALADHRMELQADTAAIAQEERALWTEIETLRQYAYLALVLDRSLQRRMNEMASSDPARVRTLGADILHPVRRRLQDILIQLAVALQGHAALRVVQQSNQEIIRAIQTATTTTAAALRTAVTVARALTDQRLVHGQIEAIHETTTGTKSGSAAVAAGTRRSGVDLAALKRAWDNVFATLDQIDSYTAAAHETMEVTVRELSGEIERSRASVDHSDRTNAGSKLGPIVAAEPLRLRIS